MSQRGAVAHFGIAVGTLARYEVGERTAPVPVVPTMARAYRRPLREVLQLSGVALEPLPPGRRWSATELPHVIRALCVASGLSTTRVGRAVGRSSEAVRCWEKGQAWPSADVCRRLEVVLEVSTGSLAAGGRV